MQRRICTIVVVLLLTVGVSVVPASAIVVRDAQDDTLYRSLGSSTLFDSVGQFVGTAPTYGFLASGTLVAPEWVLTAAHVVDDSAKLSFNIGGQTYQVDRKIVHPSWNGDLWSGSDIGLVHLVKPVDRIKPAQIYTGSGELHRADTVIGFGKAGDIEPGDTTTYGVKLGAQNIISQIENNRLLVADCESPLPAGAASLGCTHGLPLEGLISPGDSGGGLFITTPTGTYLAGVNSFVGSDSNLRNSVYGSFSGHTRVSAYSDWIEARIHGEDRAPFDASQEDNTIPRRLTVYPAPEPGSYVLLAVAAAMLGIARFLLRRPAAR